MKAEHQRTAHALGKLMSTNAGRAYLRLNHKDGCPFVVAGPSDLMPEVAQRILACADRVPMVSVVFMRNGELDGIGFAMEDFESSPNGASMHDLQILHPQETLRDFAGRLAMHSSDDQSTLIGGVRAKAFA